MTVRFGLACLVALSLGLLAAFAVSCGGGGDDRSLIASSRAEDMKNDLDAIDRYVAEGKCDAARDRLDSLRAKVEALPKRTNRKLRRRLAQGVRHLESISPGECRDNDTQTTTTTETTDTATEPAPVTTQAPPVTTQAPPVTTQAPPVTTQAPPDPNQPDPGDSGGSQAPGNSGQAPGQSKKDEIPEDGG